MASYVKFEAFSEGLVKAEHNFGTSTFKILLSNGAVSASGDTNKADLTSELGTANGYTAGGTATTISISRAGGTTTVDATNVVFTASGGSIGPFQYAILYNDTHASDALVCYWDYGTPVTITDGNTFTVDTGAGTGNDLFTLA